MHVSINVKYHSDKRTGAGKLRAKGGGRQLTIGYPFEAPMTLKYWVAVEDLADKLERLNGYRLRLISRTLEDDESDTFTFEAFAENVPRTWDNREAVKYGHV